MNKYEILKSMIDEGSRIVVFTGAGISVASGIPDFRGEKGVFTSTKKDEFNPEEVLSHSYFTSHTKEFFDFYRRKMLYENAKPSLAHKYFAELEKKGKKVVVVTQNIDGLHQAASSSLVYELHGNVHRNYCEKCNRLFGIKYILDSKEIPVCDKCGGVIKPDVVLYEEPLNEDIITRTISAIMTCDVLVVVGTSLIVYPAAGFLRYFRGKYLIVINKTETPYDNMCDLVINEDVESVIKKII
ncbi:MAG TPA: NAD-dependent protein deacylase [Bacilli bacterium]|jgi:NAD-dependent deacetylase|nr:NAD-dependent protein deacylase [Bacilli bacterium]HQA56014.1 NAD-dependent protein deacylase [Bacilli bacterium]